MDNKVEQSNKLEQYKMINFFLDNQEFAVDIFNVREVIKAEGITKLPKSPEFVVGIINLRGDIVPIINMKEKFNLPFHQINRDARIIVTDIEGRLIGILVDSVNRVIRVNSDQIVKAPPLKGSGETRFIKGVGKIGERLVVILNIDEVLTTDEKVELEELEYLIDEE